MHETLQATFFDGASVLYDEVDGERVEITLPPADELIECITLRVKRDCFLVTVDFPAMIIGSSEDKIVRQSFEYIPPPID